MASRYMVRDLLWAKKRMSLFVAIKEEVNYNDDF